MPLDFYEPNSDYNNSDEPFNLEKTAKPELIAAREHVIQTVVLNFSSRTPEKTYVTKARDYAKKFEVIGVEDWLKDGRTVFTSPENLHKWVSDLPWPHKDYYYNLSN